MSTPITPVTGTAQTGTPGSTLSGSNSVLGPDAFLQLMMVQLTHQDPTSPSDPTQYLSELAQFTQVEQATNTAQNTAQSAVEQATAEAIGLIGHTVSYIDQTTGQTTTGLVQNVTITNNGPRLTVAGVGGIDPSTISQVS